MTREDVIEETIRTVLRPLVEADGGSVEILEIGADRVVLGLGRACLGCPGVPITQRAVIEPLLRSVIGPTTTIEVKAYVTPRAVKDRP